MAPSCKLELARFSALLEIQDGAECTLSLVANWDNDSLLSMSQFGTIVKPFDLIISKTTKWLIFKHKIMIALQIHTEWVKVEYQLIMWLLLDQRENGENLEFKIFRENRIKTSLSWVVSSSVSR